jgi:aminoglycoside phosphotransferase (APT) family kinase protein
MIADALHTAGRLGAATARLAVDRSLMASGDVPWSLAELSPRWLSAALQDVSPGASVASWRLLDQHSGTSARARIELTYAARGSGAPPATLFVKVAPSVFPQRLFFTLVGLGRNEVVLYRDAGTDLPVRIPRVYHAAIAGEGQRAVLLLEDLHAAGARFVTVGERAERSELRTVVGELAKLHAAFWESPRFATDLARLPSFENRRGEMPWERFVTGKMLAMAKRRFADELPEGFTAIADLCIRQRDCLENLWARGPRTLVHGDCHIGNLFFVGGRVGFLDWQVASRAPGIRDVAYFLCNSAPSELRQQLERELLASYLGDLRAAGVAAPSDDDAWTAYRLFALYSWIAAAFTAAAGDGLQPRAVGLAGLRRATAAVLDLDSLGCFARES